MTKFAENQDEFRLLEKIINKKLLKNHFRNFRMFGLITCKSMCIVKLGKI